MTTYSRTVTSLIKPLSTKLPHLDIELTDRCNNNCIHCSINRQENDIKALRAEMSTIEVKEILKQAADLGCLQVRFTGGEPLLRSDFIEIYLFARKIGMKVLLFTNGRLISPELISIFEHTPPRMEIEVSVYGMNEESYNKSTRTIGGYEQYINGIRLLQKSNIPYIVKFVVLPYNKNEIDEFESSIQSNPWMGNQSSYCLFFNLRRRDNNYQKNHLIKSIRISPSEGLKILTRDESKYRNEMKSFAKNFIGPPGKNLFNCGAGHTLCINAYGYVLPCMNLNGFDIKLTNKNSLSDALDEFSILSQIRPLNISYLERCSKCFLMGLCEQCPAKSLSESGTLDTPIDYFCQIAHEQARYLGWLNENEFAWEIRNWRDRIS